MKKPFFALFLLTTAGFLPAQTQLGRSDAETYTNSIGMEFAKITNGSFLMGSDGVGCKGVKPVHRVTISRSFYLQTREVNQAQWQEVMGRTVAQQRDLTNKSFGLGTEGDNYPIYYVSWYDAQEFIRKLNAQDPGKGYRLPTEAEWEYAAQPGMLYHDNMVGGVSEWCADWHGPYQSGDVTDPTGPSKGSTRVMRGGSWYFAGFCDYTSRSSDGPGERAKNLGFRLVRSSP